MVVSDEAWDKVSELVWEVLTSDVNSGMCTI